MSAISLPAVFSIFSAVSGCNRYLGKLNTVHTGAKNAIRNIQPVIIVMGYMNKNDL